MICPNCDGCGEVCDGCGSALSSVSQKCESCGGQFCAIVRRAATRVSDGAKVDIGDVDHFSNHVCRPIGTEPQCKGASE